MKRIWLAVLVALVGCSKQRPKEPENAPEVPYSTFGLMNFRQIRSAYASSLGISAYEKGVFYAFDELKGRLPANNSPDQLTQPAVTAVIGLGGAFCYELVEREWRIKPQARVFFGDLSLGQAPEEFALKASARHLTEALWRRPARQEELAELVSLGRDIYELGMAKPQASTVTAGKETWLSLCSAVAASVDSLTL